MRPFNLVIWAITDVGVVRLEFVVWRPQRAILPSRGRPAASGPINEPVAILEVSFVREDPNDATSLPVRVDSVGLWDAEGVTPATLKRFGWTRWLEAAEAIARSGKGDGTIEWASADRYDPNTVTGKVQRGTWEEQGVKLPARRPGRKGHPDSFYREVADRYLELRTEGSRSPTMQIAIERFVSRDTAAGWVRRARELSLLPPARKGRAG